MRRLTLGRAIRIIQPQIDREIWYGMSSALGGRCFEISGANPYWVQRGRLTDGNRWIPFPDLQPMRPEADASTGDPARPHKET